MNNKNMIGNGSKATLPGGQKLSDKIQENKTKQNLNNNNNGKVNNSNNNLNGKENSNNSKSSKGKEENGENKKSKLDNATQQAGTEAARTALKTFAASNPYTSWIPKGIRDKIVDKIVDSKLGQEAIEKQGKKLKRKVVFALLGAVAATLFQTFLICAIIAAILSPVAAIKDALGDVGKFFVSVWNIFKFGELCENESECQEKLGNKYYEKLDSIVNDNFKDCVDKQQVKDLITSTIFYDQMTYAYNYQEYQKKDNNSEKSDEDKKDESLIEKSDEDKEDESLIEINEDGYFDYRGKREKIQPLVDKLKSGDSNSCILNSYAYRNHLTSTYVKANYDYILIGHFKDGVEGTLTIEEVVNEIMMIGGFENKGSNGSCSDSCSYNINGESISGLKVRLINGAYSDSPGTPIEGEELVPFEKYILGVVYGEVGSGASDEVIKAQAIAARSYALTRPQIMGGALGRGIKEENGEWILTLVNSTEDQVYCDPDKGCSKINGVNSTVYSDPDKYEKYKGPLSAEERIRTVVGEVAGKVVLDENGEIVNTSYTNENQNRWAEKAAEGKDYTVILREDYAVFNTIDDGNCSSLCNAAIGPFTEWKQASWPDVKMNNLTIKQAGCLTVSVCMQVARSGVKTPLGDNFNPGTFVNEYRKYLYRNDNWVWGGISTVIEKFKYDSTYKITGMQYMTDAEQRNKLMEGINAGCYYVVEVKSYRQNQHWVAIDVIKDGEIYIMDPASDCKILSQCKASEGFMYRISTAQCYRVVE